jgi:hypothetical protein
MLIKADNQNIRDTICSQVSKGFLGQWGILETILNQIINSMHKYFGEVELFSHNVFEFLSWLLNKLEFS